MLRAWRSGNARSGPGPNRTSQRGPRTTDPPGKRARQGHGAAQVPVPRAPQRHRCRPDAPTPRPPATPPSPAVKSRHPLSPATAAPATASTALYTQAARDRKSSISTGRARWGRGAPRDRGSPAHTRRDGGEAPQLSRKAARATRLSGRRWQIRFPAGGSRREVASGGVSLPTGAAGSCFAPWGPPWRREHLDSACRA